jgi:Cu(I)/Ag(I) efflux system membrane protein CusA/SilA
MAIRSEGGKRTQYVLLNARGRGEVEVVRDADARLRAALPTARSNCPPAPPTAGSAATSRSSRPTRPCAGSSRVDGVMVVLIYVGTRSWLITAIIILCNAHRHDRGRISSSSGCGAPR